MSTFEPGSFVAYKRKSGEIAKRQVDRHNKLTARVYFVDDNRPLHDAEERCIPWPVYEASLPQRHVTQAEKHLANSIADNREYAKHGYVPYLQQVVEEEARAEYPLVAVDNAVGSTFTMLQALATKTGLPIVTAMRNPTNVEKGEYLVRKLQRLARELSSIGATLRHPMCGLDYPPQLQASDALLEELQLKRRQEGDAIYARLGAPDLARFDTSLACPPHLKERHGELEKAWLEADNAVDYSPEHLVFLRWREAMARNAYENEKLQDNFAKHMKEMQKTALEALSATAPLMGLKGSWG